MSLRILDLDQICISSSADGLTLSLATSISVRVPGELAASNGNDIVKDLASGKVWASRGRRCRLGLQLSLNGRLLDRNDRLRILESLGYHLRDAQLWSQLSLSPSLKISNQDDSTKADTDISLHLNRSTGSIVDTHPRGWLLDNVDVNPPGTVLCVEFEKLHLQLDFITNCKPSKRSKQHSETSGATDLMLLDFCPLLGEETHLEELEDVVDILSKSLPAAVGVLFEDPGTASHLPPKRVSFTRAARETLQQWFDEHQNHPYPTSGEKDLLTQRISLTRKQVDQWFVDARKRAKRNGTALPWTNPAITSQDPGHDLEDPKDEMLLSSPTDHEYQKDDEIMLLSSSDDPEEEMLFSQTPSLTSHLSTISSTSLPTLKRPRTPTPTDIPSLHPETINTLTAHTLQILLSGSPPRQAPTKTTQVSKITTTKPPVNPLAALLPSIWSPGYTQLIAHHTSFLPVIERAISSSWARNAVGVGLRGVLGELASTRVWEFDPSDENLSDENTGMVGTARDTGMDTSPPNHQNANTQEEVTRGEPRSMARLNAVVQTRLWRMMQRTLYDPKSAKRLRWDPISSVSVEGEEDVNLFAGFGTDVAIDHETRDEGNVEENTEKRDVGDGDEEEEEDEGLLSYFDEEEWEAEEWETGGSEERDVEMETDEMLFGDGDENGEEELLFGVFIENTVEEERDIGAVDMGEEEEVGMLI